MVYVYKQESNCNYKVLLDILSVLKTFIHDPLVEWEKVRGRPTSAEATNEKVCMYVY